MFDDLEEDVRSALRPGETLAFIAHSNRVVNVRSMEAAQQGLIGRRGCVGVTNARVILVTQTGEQIDFPFSEMLPMVDVPTRETTDLLGGWRIVIQASGPNLMYETGFRARKTAEDCRDAIARGVGLTAEQKERVAYQSETRLDPSELMRPVDDPLDPPATPDEVHEALMNPWPGHSMHETITRNRGSH